MFYSVARFNVPVRQASDEECLYCRESLGDALSFCPLLPKGDKVLLADTGEMR
jgi:hypothetical protein